MRRTAVLAVVVLAVLLAPSPEVGAAACGRAGYPDAGAFDAAAVVDATRWDALVARDGFGDAVEGLARVEAGAAAAGTNYTAILEEVVVREYVGGRAEDVTAIRLRVVEERAGAPPIVLDFAPVGFSGRAGGNLTLAVTAQGDGADVFWRWGYLVCDGTLPSDYYVFHARVEGGAIAQGNVLVYFEATRPHGEPPTDMILLIIAGIAVSAVFLLAHRTLRKG